jgi:hypothetical protein
MRRLTLLLLSAAILALAAAGIRATHGGSAAQAASTRLGAKAWARVISNGTFDATRSRNISGITTAGAGFYCITLPFTVQNVSATVNAVSAPAIAMAGLVGTKIDGGTSCPAPAKGTSEVFVRTFSVSAGGATPADVPFYVVMH